MDSSADDALGGAVEPMWTITDSTGTSNGAGPSQMGDCRSDDVSVAVINDTESSSSTTSSTKFVIGPPPHKPITGKGKATVVRSQKPAARRDERGLVELEAIVRGCATYDNRVNPNGSSELQTPPLESLNPHDVEWGVPESVGWETVRVMTKEERDEVKRMATVLKERTVDMPLIRQKLDSSAWVGEEDEGSYEHMLAAKLTREERRIFRTHSAFEPVNALDIGISDADLLGNGLSLAKTQELTESPIVIPPLPTPDNLNVTSMICAYGCKGCHGRGAEVPLLSMLHSVEVLRSDKKTADACIVKLVKTLVINKESNSLMAMQERVAKTVCCNNCDCKIAAGVISIEDRLKHNSSANQDANQVNGNRRYGSDKQFEESISLGRRLFVEHEDFGAVEARRLVEDTAQFAYWLVARGQEAIGTCHAFIEQCRVLGMPWCHQTCQAFLDRASTVPRNHVLRTIADHVVSPLKSFGVTDKRTWDTYFTDCLCKMMYPDPLTGIALFVRVKNWEGNGRPVKVNAQGQVTLVDYVDPNHEGIALMRDAAGFHRAVKDFMILRQTHKVFIRSSASEGALGEDPRSANYKRSFNDIARSVGTSGAKERAMMAKFMHANGTDDKDSVSLRSMIRTNGTKVGSQFAPACATLFLNNNVTTLWRVIYWARAYGLDADFQFGYDGGKRVGLDNFSEKHLPTLFLESCKDQSKGGQGANGYKIVPSHVVDSPEVAGAAERRASREKYRETSQPLGKGPEDRLDIYNSACATCKGVPTGFGLSDPQDQVEQGKKARVRTMPVWEILEDGGYTSSKFCEKAPMEEAVQHALNNYRRLIHEGVIKEDTKFEYYATMDVPHQLMQWGISRERRKKLWYDWLREVKPALFVHLVDTGRLGAEWCVGMSEDPEGTADGDLKTHNDYLAVVAECKKRAKEAVIRLEDLPGGLPREPSHFSYWCSVQRIDPVALWPTDEELRTQFAKKQLLRRESELLRLRDCVKVALDKERGTSLRQLKPGATREEKDARIAADVCDVSERWTQAMDIFNALSMHTDRVLKPRLTQWLCGQPRDDDSAEEKAHTARLEKLYAQDLEMRFNGGAAHELERRRVALGNHGYNSVDDERARVNAELHVLRQDMTRGEIAADDNRRATAAANVLEAEDLNGIVPEVSLRREDLRFNAANSASAHGDVEPQPPKESEPTPANVYQGALEFSSTADSSTAANLNAVIYFNPRLQGLGWCDDHGRPPPASQPPSKRPKL